MGFTRGQKRGSAAVAAAAVTVAGVILATAGGGGVTSSAGPRYIGYLERIGQGEEAEEGREREEERPEGIVGGANEESAEIFNALSSVANARLAPRGSVPAGLLSAEMGEFKSLASNGSSWNEVTDMPYDADDPDYRDPSFSNSSGGSGFVAGRITGLAVGNGYMFAGGANGGVFRKTLGANLDSTSDDGAWTPISDSILSLSTGDLVYDADNDTLWYATGEANTGATSYAGSGVYRLEGASTGTFTDADRVGGIELESRGINQLKIDSRRGVIYAATTRGLWRHSLAGDAAWSLVFMPNPADDTDITKPYNNIVNDVAVQPGTGAVLANAAWRSGAAYNGFYYSSTGNAGSFTLVNPKGGLQKEDVGNTEFAYSADGTRLYALVESPNKLNHSPQTVLDGVYRSDTGRLEGPWNRIASSGKLAGSDSALGGSGGVNYRPGVQAWYNNFIEVDPANANHVYVGLEEVYETTNGGSNWSTPGPYWNFGFSCWDISDPQGGCPQTTHSDQHSIAIDDGYVYVGNDGGVKSRPVPPAQSKEDALNHGSDWLNHSAGLGTLQYYSVGVGKDGSGYLVAGGLQDNGGSLLRAGASEMVSPFGGDGGDIIVDADNGCQILDEYVFLNLWMTKNCGKTKGDVSAVFDITVPDPNPRFTAPFRIVRGSQNTGDGSTERWIAGGNKVWTHDKAFSYTREEAEEDASHGWRKVADLGTAGRMTVGLDAIANPSAPKDSSKDVVYAAWCGESNCNSAGFTSGVASNYGGTWRELSMKDSNSGLTLPNRYPNAVWIDEKADAAGSTIYLVYNGYNRRFIEGPGAGVQHVFKGVVSTATNSDGALQVDWTDISGNMPDVPATDVLRVGNTLVVGTDYGVIVRPVAGGDWKRVGASPGSSSAALPLTTVYDLHLGPDGYLYAGTHGRGIWRTSTSGW